MKYKLDHGANSVYSLQYHYVQVVKNRKKVLDNPNIINFLNQIIREISETYQVDVLDIGVDNDHFHMIFKSKPSLDIPDYLNTIKKITSSEIIKNFPEVKNNFLINSLWSSSYFLATIGQVTLDQLKNWYCPTP